MLRCKISCAYLRVQWLAAAPLFRDTQCVNVVCAAWDGIVSRALMSQSVMQIPPPPTENFASAVWPSAKKMPFLPSEAAHLPRRTAQYFFFSQNSGSLLETAQNPSFCLMIRQVASGPCLLLCASTILVAISLQLDYLTCEPVLQRNKEG